MVQIVRDSAVNRLVVAAGAGDVTGPASATDNAIARYDGTTGKIIQNSAVFISDSGNLGINIAPVAAFHIDKNMSASAWGLNGIGIRQEADTYTDTSSSGTVASVVAHSIGVPTLAASNVTTYTSAPTFYIAGPPTAGTNVTITNPLALYAAGRGRFDGRLGIGIAPSSQFHINNSGSFPAWTSSGVGIRVDTNTYTDSSSSGTVANNFIHRISAPSIAASNVTTFTDAATFNVGGPPTAGTNVTITNPLALYVSSGNSRFSGSIGIGINPTASLHVAQNLTRTAWSNFGAGLRIDPATFTDTSSSGVTGFSCVHTVRIPTIAASSVTTYTTAPTLYIEGPAAAGTNVTITNPLALWIDAGDTRLDGYLGVGGSSVTTQAATINIVTNTDKGLIVKGAASQSGNYLEIQNSGGTPLVTVASTGATTFVSQYSATRFTCTTTLSWNNGNRQTIVLANGGQTFTFANPLSAGMYLLELKQPPSGAAGTVTWPATVKWGGGTVPTLTATNGQTDLITFYYNGTNYAGSAALNYAL